MKRGSDHAERVRRRRVARRLALALALTASLLLALAAGAPAVIVHLRSGRAISFQPLRGVRPHAHLDELFSNLEYDGGSVMPANTNYTVYWDPSGAPAYPSEYKQGIDRYLEDLQHDSAMHENGNVDSVDAQYGDAEGHLAAYNSHFGGRLIDTDPYPANGCTAAAICLDDEQIRAELTKFVKAQGKPTNLETEYFLLTPPGVESCFEEDGFECSAGTPEGFAAYCAFHDNIALPKGAELIYANDPFVDENEGCDDGNHPNGVSDSALEGGLSHEHSESLTDPEPNSAWANYFEGGSEIGDKCRTGFASSEFGSPLGETKAGVKWNQVINGHDYWYQQEWSNTGHKCLQRLSSFSAPTASFTYKAAGHREGSFSAAASTGGARYDWEFNDEPPGLTESVPVEQTSPEITHPFPYGCTYRVALTVFAEHGASAGTAQTVQVPPVAEAIVETSTPVAGTPVSFLASEGGPSEEFDVWSFGDGSEATGETPRHTYAAPGSYEVTLTASDPCGESVTVHRRVTVAPASGATGSGGGGATPAPALVPAPLISAPLPASPLPTGTITLPATIAVRRSGRASATLRCAGTAPTCSGAVTLTARRTTLVAGHRRTRPVTLGTFAFTVPDGHATVVHFTLRRLGRALVRASRGGVRATAALRRSVPAPAAASVASVRLVLVHAGR